MADAPTLLHLEESDAPVGGQLRELSRIFPKDPVDYRELPVEPSVQLGVEPRLDEEQDTHGKENNDERQHPRMPQRQARTDAESTAAHACLAPSTNPMPRTVCRSF